MEIQPRYDGPPIIELDGDLREVVGPALRQRERFATRLGTLAAHRWSTLSRCEGWRVQDVVAHLDSTNGFWLHSIRSGLAGQPSKVLVGFDPKATPALLAAASTRSPDELLERYHQANEELAALVADLDDEALARTAESPAGHVSIALVLHHALWDSWVHERDVFGPMGFDSPEEPDELAPALRYAAALAPALALSRDGGRRGALTVAATDPEVSFAIVADGSVRITAEPAPDPDVHLAGPAVGLIESLSIRAPLPVAPPASAPWLLETLGEVFEASQEA